jgi:hypothetical protein
MGENESRFDVILGGDATGLGAAANTAVNEINRVHHTLRAIPTQMISRFGSALAGMFSAGAIISQVRGLQQWIEAIGALSQKTDVATDKLMAWDYAGKRANLTLGDWESALRRIAMAQERAKRGGQQAWQFEQLGIKQDQLEKMTRGELFEQVWQKYNAGGLTESQRQAVSRMVGGHLGGQKFFEVFGESGPEEAYRRAVEDRIIVEQDLIARTKNLGDDLAQLGMQMRIQFIPVLDLLVKAIGYTIAAFNGIGAALGSVVGNLSNIMEELRIEWAKAKEIIKPRESLSDIGNRIGARMREKEESSGFLTVIKGFLNSKPSDVAGGVVSSVANYMRDDAVRRISSSLNAAINATEDAKRRGFNPDWYTPSQAFKDQFKAVMQRLNEPLLNVAASFGEDEYERMKRGGGGDSLARIGGFIGAGGGVSIQREMLHEQRKTTAAVKEVVFTVERNFTIQ